MWRRKEQDLEPLFGALRVGSKRIRRLLVSGTCKRLLFVLNFLGHPRSERPLFPNRAAAFREETEKQKARRCRAQEFGPKQCPEKMSARTMREY